ncbi:MAG: DUF2892 domain-containing protein [Phycisphaeraceae bacterium]
MVLPANADRVQRHTDPKLNRQIEEETNYRITYYAHNTDEIDARLRELDQEWSIERALQANAATLALTGMCMGTTLKRRWYLLSAGVMGFLLQHAIQGWCPPVEAFRRLGFRTPSEIEQERSALKALRGDFDIDPPREDNVSRRAEQAMAAVRRHAEPRGYDATAAPPT